MAETRTGLLERSCDPRIRDWIRTGPPADAMERSEAFFSGRGFDPHRHDTYAIGITMQGVQSFRYRGALRHSLPGQAFVLHPDEVHDGHAGTDRGFRYRSLYIEPRFIHDSLGARRPLPFLRHAVSSDRRLLAAVARVLGDIETPLEELQRDTAVVDIADALAALDASPPEAAIPARHSRAVDAARAFLDAALGAPVRSADLERETGMSRYALARQFRLQLGTSPYRYLTMRRLDRARRLIRDGAAIADAALMSGFADQSHMTRQFKKAYGLTPARWARLAA